MKHSNKQKLYEEQKGKCFFCDKILPIDALTFDHLLPKSLGNDDSASNLVLSCPECNMQRGGKLPFREIEFAYFLRQLLDKHPEFRNITQEAKISGEVRYRADILAEQNINGKWKKILIEVKSLPTFTSKRLGEVVNQLNHYKSLVKDDVKFVLSFPGILPKKDNDFLKSANIEVWDREYITNTFESEIEQIEDKLFLKLFRFSSIKPKIQESLVTELKSILAGRPDWSRYQKHIGLIDGCYGNG